MAITVAQLQTHLEAARTAITSQDYTTAWREAMAAQAVLAGLADGRHGEAEVTWRETITNLLREIKAARAVAASETAGGLVRTPVTYTRPST